MSALQSLRDRLAELADLTSLGRLAAWDQRTMMPPGGAAARAQQFASLERITHARATSEDIGAWLDGHGDGSAWRSASGASTSPRTRSA